MSGPRSDNESEDEEHVNKENTPTNASAAEANKQAAPEVRIIKVGGVSFLLDHESLKRLNSEFLNRKLALKAADTTAVAVGKSSPSIQQQGSSPHRRATNLDDEPVVTVVIEDADAESFSSFVHLARFGTLPTSIFNKEKREQLLQQAESVWGIRTQVEEALDKARTDFRTSCECLSVIERCLLFSPMSSTPPNFYQAGSNTAAPEFVPSQVVVPPVAAQRSSSSAASLPAGASAICLGGPHHNFRRDDGSRRVFCSSCGHRDIDWRYHVGDYYSNCDKCQKEITYKPDLGWCHKCRQCNSCQTSECPGVPIRQLEEQVIPYMMTALKLNETEMSFF